MPDVAKVVDFGLVKEIDASRRDRSRRQARRTCCGHAAYLAPEAITDPGDGRRRAAISTRSAPSATSCSPGSRVFEGRTLVEFCAHHLHTPPVPPSVRLGRALDPAH